MSAIYTNTSISQCRLAFISEKKLAGSVSDIDTVFFVNRESDNRQDHTKNVMELAAAHNRLGLKEPFAPFRFYGSGCLRFLNDVGWKGRYFRQLRKLIEDGLRHTQGTLYIITTFIDRLFRPFGFDPHDEATWTLTDTDYNLIAAWLTNIFGNRSQDITFVRLFEGTPGEIRGLETSKGMQCRGNMGGKPSKVKKSRIGKSMRVWLQTVAVFLLENGKSVQKIQQHFENRGVSVTERAIQKWAKAVGLSRLPGRPKDSVKPQ